MMNNIFMSEMERVVKESVVLLVMINPLKAELNPICHLLAILGALLILHVSRIRVNKVSSQCTDYFLHSKYLPDYTVPYLRRLQFEGSKFFGQYY